MPPVILLLFQVDLKLRFEEIGSPADVDDTKKLLLQEDVAKALGCVHDLHLCKCVRSVFMLKVGLENALA